MQPLLIAKFPRTHQIRRAAFRGQFVPRISGAIWANRFFGLFPLLFLLTSCAFLPGKPQGSNQLAIQQTPKARLTYVAIGASDTFGTGTDDPQNESWPADLALKLGSGVRFINLGIPGIHAREALQVELPVAIDARPDLVTVWLAVNDLADHVPTDSYARDLDTLLGYLQKALPHARIAVANVPDLTLLPRFRSANISALRSQITAYNTAIATVVARHHTILVDLYSRWSELANHPEYISNDGFHPNALGYTRIAQIFSMVLSS